MTSEELYRMAIKRLAMLALVNMAAAKEKQPETAAEEEAEQHGKEVLAL